VEKDVEFASVQTECQVVASIKWTDFLERTKDVIGMETVCEVKSAVDCKDALVKKCDTVSWNDCQMEPVEECSNVLVYQPGQEKVHQKKCLTD